MVDSGWGGECIVLCRQDSEIDMVLPLESTFSFVFTGYLEQSFANVVWTR